MPDATTRLRIVLANMIADTETAREIVRECKSPNDGEYLEREIDRIQAAAHRILALLDHVAIEEPRQ